MASKLDPKPSHTGQGALFVKLSKSLHRKKKRIAEVRPSLWKRVQESCGGSHKTTSQEERREENVISWKTVEILYKMVYSNKLINGKICLKALIVVQVKI